MTRKECRESLMENGAAGVVQESARTIGEDRLGGLHLKAICFDLDGTLYSASSLRIRMFGVLLKACARGKISRLELQALKAYRGVREDARKMTPRTGIDAFTLEAAAQKSGSSAAALGQLVDRWMYRAPLPFLAELGDPDLRRMMTRLRLRGYRLAVYSDYPVREKLQSLSLPLGLFDALVESGEADVDSLKPHPRGFLEVCRRLSLEPGEVLFVGDRDPVDGAGARAVGMPFALLKRSPLAARTRDTIRRLSDLETLLGACENSAPLLARAAETTACWLCGSRDAEEYLCERLPATLSPELARMTDMHYGMTARLLECAACGFIYADRASAKSIERLYPEMADPQYEKLAAARRKSSRKLLQRIRRALPGGNRLLDVGAATGAFCAEARNFGFVAEGVEPSAWAVSEADKRYGVKLHQGYFPHPSLEGREFDVITLRDVIEHVSRPVEFLAAARRCLARQGLLVVITPDAASWAPRVLGRRWWHFRPAHLGYFTAATLAAALGRAGFVLRNREPFTRWLPVNYVLARLLANAPGVGRVLTGFANRLDRLHSPSLPLTLRDDFVHYAEPIGRNCR